MDVHKIEPNSWCSCCDEDLAAVEISNNGEFKLFWAAGPHDNELCLCPKCFKELRDKMNAITI